MDMDEREQKQLARRRRERRLRGWLITLSWSTPIVAFGGFFTIWHHISNAVNPPQPTTQSDSTTSAGTNSASTGQNQILFQIGSRSNQVRNIQSQLAELGYFQHETTSYYGTVTADAVKTFQADHQLPQTGSIDSSTLAAIQQAVKDNSANSLVQSGDSGHSQSNGASDNSDNGNTYNGDNSYNQPAYGSYSDSYSYGPSQQQNPVTTSSAS